MDTSYVVNDTESKPEDMEHFYPYLRPGSPHLSDDELVDPPAYAGSSSDEGEVFDGTVFASISSQGRLESDISSWCSCEGCDTETIGTDRECVCCRESYLVQKHMGEQSCITEVGLFKELVLNKEGLIYSRYLFSLTIQDEERRTRYMTTKLEDNPSKMRFLAYKAFVNILSMTDFDRNMRYVLPACVVSAIRKAFPNPEGVGYTGYTTLSTSQAQSLP